MSKPDNLPVAVEQSDQEIERDRAEAFKIVKRIYAAISEGRKASWELAGALYDFREAKGWLKLGYDTMGEWLAEPEVSMTWPTFDRLVGVYGYFVIKRGLDSSTLTNLDLSKAHIVRPALNRGEVLLEDALSDIEVLGARDLREKYVKPKEDPEPPSDPEPQGPADKPSGEPEAVTGEVVDSKDFSPADAGQLDEMLEDWSALRADLRLAVESGTDFPRITGTYIETGLEALQGLVRAGIDPDIIFED